MFSAKSVQNDVDAMSAFFSHPSFVLEYDAHTYPWLRFSDNCSHTPGSEFFLTCLLQTLLAQYHVLYQDNGTFNEPIYQHTATGDGDLLQEQL